MMAYIQRLSTGHWYILSEYSRTGNRSTGKINRRNENGDWQRYVQTACSCCTSPLPRSGTCTRFRGTFTYNFKKQFYPCASGLL